MTARLKLEYDGGAFSGWAAQPGFRTVQGTVEEALRTILQRPVRLTVAGRTDTGVHARGQVASHEGPPAPVRSLNSLLPHDVRVVASEEAPPGFDARRDALGRTYRYRLHLREAASPFEHGRALHVRPPLDRAPLDACAAVVLGTHDFTAFTPTQTDHVRMERVVARSEWLEDGEFLDYWIEADAFMRRMVRTLVGTMLDVAGGRIPIGEFRGLLAGRTRPEAGETAPAHGLYLESVRY